MGEDSAKVWWNSEEYHSTEVEWVNVRAMDVPPSLACVPATQQDSTWYPDKYPSPRAPFWGDTYYTEPFNAMESVQRLFPILVAQGEPI